MAVYLRYYETDEQYQEERDTNYFEPWVSLTDEVSGAVVERVDYNEPHLFKIEIKGLKVLADVPASGGTIDKDDCTYVVNAVYSDMNKVDVTASATVSGSLAVPSSQIERRHSAGTITLTATYDEFEATASAKVYQEAFIPSITAITIDNLTWVTDIPADGGTATKDNCTFKVTSHYDNGTSGNVTNLAEVTGSLVVESSDIMERHSVGTLTLTATYDEFSANGSVTAYQEAFKNYLTFNILSGGNIAFGAIPWGGSNSATTLTIEYKKNDGEWASLTSTVWSWSTSVETREDAVNSFSSKFSVDAGDVVRFRGNNQAYAVYNNVEDGIVNFNAFLSTASFNVEGNIMSLINKDNFDTLNTLTAPATFAYLFSGCYNLISAEDLLLPATTLSVGCYSSMFYDLIGNGLLGTDMNMSLTTTPELPATTLTQGCYEYMFDGCTSLTTTPTLLATTLAQSCYSGMFRGCTNLTTTPSALPATTLAEHCYDNMFYGCTSLTVAPELPATTLAVYCYGNMFQGCTSLTTAPALPATTLAESCYCFMFYGCTSLTTAPELPATTLANYCYQGMFSGCTNLNYIKCLATTNITPSNTRNWVSGVQTNSGTFVKNPNASNWPTGNNGIPTNWTVQDNT